MSVAAQNAAASTSSMSCRIHTIGKSWQLTLNQRVPGSSPGAPTTFPRKSEVITRW